MKTKAFCAGDFVIIFIGILGFVYECFGQLAKQLNEANILKKGLDLIADTDTIEEKAEAEQTMRAELRGVAVAAAASLGHTAGHGMKGAIPPSVLIREIRGKSGDHDTEALASSFITEAAVRGSSAWAGGGAGAFGGGGGGASGGGGTAVRSAALAGLWNASKLSLSRSWGHLTLLE